ncbi:STAS domain-containing protein [Magnetospirillum sp. UT-4]|uniref:STAS domain-containing protein n=1 Tax=Magnetospirillum sp. UT-4 TaxID=2681467 RepID=UPI00137C5F68|nr:STAS domain-containing protein [Magnetospirillum sp. UT-4]CAA7613359.1 Anti-sigma factor antagonist [Magnetospirillum sp. UT-4]
MNVDTREMNGWVVVTLAGEVDLQHSPTVRKHLMELMFERRDVAVDLSGVVYIDSSGIASLVEAYQMARKGGNKLVLAPISQSAMRVLQLARLDKVFAIADSLDAAMAG